MNDVHLGSRASGNGPGTKRKLCHNRMERGQDVMKYELPSQPTNHGWFPKEKNNNYSAQLQIKIFYWHATQYKHCQCVEKAETLGNCQQ